MTQAVFIYALIDPRDGAIRYVGKAVECRRRLGQHYSDTRCNRHKSNWVKSLRAAGCRPEMEVLEQFVGVPDEEWQEAERFWIAYFRFLGFRLTNLDVGGFGGSGRSPETRARIAHAMRGRTKSPETIEKMRLAQSSRGPRSLSEEHRLNISKGLTGKKMPPRDEAWREDRRKKMTGRKDSPEVRAKKSASAKARFVKVP